jgi:hypothetical protein
MPPALTGEMDDLTRRRFNKHFDSCEACRREFKELTATWNALVIPKQVHLTVNAPAQLKLYRTKRIFLDSELASRAATAAIIAAIILLIMLPFLLGKPKQPSTNWYNQNNSQSAAARSLQY